MIKLKNLLNEDNDQNNNGYPDNTETSSFIQNLIGKIRSNYTRIDSLQIQNKKNVVRNFKIIGFVNNNPWIAQLKDEALNRTYVVEIDPNIPLKGGGYFAELANDYTGTDQMGNIWLVQRNKEAGGLPYWDYAKLETSTDPIYTVYPFVEKPATKKGKETANLVVELLDQIRKAIKILPNQIKNMSAQAPGTLSVFTPGVSKLSAAQLFTGGGQKSVESMLMPLVDDALRSAVDDLKNEEGNFPGKSKLTVQIVKMEKDEEGWEVPVLAKSTTQLSINQIKQLLDRTQQLVNSLDEYVYFSDDTTEIIDNLATEINSIVNISMN